MRCARDVRNTTLLMISQGLDCFPSSLSCPHHSERRSKSNKRSKAKDNTLFLEARSAQSRSWIMCQGACFRKLRPSLIHTWPRRIRGGLPFGDTPRGPKSDFRPTIRTKRSCSERICQAGTGCKRAQTIALGCDWTMLSSCGRRQYK